MKVSNSIRNLYNENKQVYDRLKNEVDEHLGKSKDKKWHYLSRVKSLESFALKVETGRFENPGEMEDFFACTLVVENKSSIEKAMSLVCGRYEIMSRRPKNPDITHLQPDSFAFDDLRLYVKLLKSDTVPPKLHIQEKTFEIQIKTFLQHAWSIATHDILYKGDRVNWANSRIAFQIKAMLENAEKSIHFVTLNNFEKVENRRNEDSLRTNNVIDFISEKWESEMLPNDKIRMAHNILAFAKDIRLDIDLLIKTVEASAQQNRGYKIKNLSPFYAIIDSWFRSEPEKAKIYLYKKNKRLNLVLPRELQLPENIDNSKIEKCILLQ